MDVKTVVYRFSHRGLCAITLIVNHSRFKLLCLTNTPLIFERFASRSFSNRSPLEEGMLQSFLTSTSMYKSDTSRERRQSFFESSPPSGPRHEESVRAWGEVKTTDSGFQRIPISNLQVTITKQFISFFKNRVLYPSTNICPLIECIASEFYLASPCNPRAYAPGYWYVVPSVHGCFLAETPKSMFL